MNVLVFSLGAIKNIKHGMLVIPRRKSFIRSGYTEDKSTANQTLREPQKAPRSIDGYLEW